MPKKITKLTPEQKARLPEYRDKWIKIGLSTEPADRERAEAAYRACYRFVGLNDQVPVVWVSSPIIGAIAAPIADNIWGGLGEVRSAVHSSVRSEVDFAVYQSVDCALDSVVDSSVRSALAAGCLWKKWRRRKKMTLDLFIAIGVFLMVILFADSRKETQP